MRVILSLTTAWLANLFVTAASAGSFPGGLLPEENPNVVCLAAARQAAEEFGVSEDVLILIGLVESGRNVKNVRIPWPWSLNANGRGEWFASREEALARLGALLDAGIRSIDVGCFQVNLYWHGEAFESPAQALDPLANARQAARFLRRLKDEDSSQGRDWFDAAERYHSRKTAKRAEYRRRLRENLAALGQVQRQAPARKLLPSPKQASSAKGNPSLAGAWVLPQDTIEPFVKLAPRSGFFAQPMGEVAP